MTDVSWTVELLNHTLYLVSLLHNVKPQTLHVFHAYTKDIGMLLLKSLYEWVELQFLAQGQMAHAKIKPVTFELCRVTFSEKFGSNQKAALLLSALLLE